MRRKRLSFHSRGRTAAGRNPDLSPEDHYIRRLTNRIDGAVQREKKIIFSSLGIDEPKPLREDVVKRLRKGVNAYEELAQSVGDERMPGCGAVVSIAVGYRPKAKVDAPKLLDEKQMARRLSLISNLNFYLRSRASEKHRSGNPRVGFKKTWPGLPRLAVTLSPGDSKALVDAVQSGAMTPEQFRKHLCVLSKKLRDGFRKATALGGARGLEAEFCVWHLEQGCLHCHLYYREIDITDPQRSRLGLRGRTTKGKEETRDRVTLNGLGMSGVTMWRHREAGHQPPPSQLAKGTLIRDWSVLDKTLAARKAKGLGECWDIVLSRHVDKFWAGVFSATPALLRCHQKGHDSWVKEWDTLRMEKYKMLKEKAGGLFKEELAEREALLEKNVQLEKENKGERRNTGLATKVQITEWVDALRTVMRGGSPSLKHEVLFEPHCSGRRLLVGGIGSAERVIESCDPRDPGVVAAKEFLSLAQTYKAALDRYVDLIFDQNEAAAEAFLAGEEKKWLASVPSPTPHPLEVVVAQKDAQLREKDAQLQELQDRLAEAVPAWQSWSSTQLHEALERIATGRENGRDELLLDHHGYIAPQVRDKLLLWQNSLDPRERADARSALDVVQMHDARVRIRLFKDAGVELPRDVPRPDPDDGDRWKRSGG